MNQTKWKSMTSTFFKISLFKFHAKYHDDDGVGGEIVPRVISPPQTFVITVKSE